MSDGLYLGEFSDRETVAREFGISLPDDVEIIVAAYDTPPYEGYAFVLFRQGGAYYEVNGSHCSCHGLSEDSYSDGDTQWKPEAADLRELVKRPRYVGYESEAEPWQEMIRAKIREVT